MEYAIECTGLQKDYPDFTLGPLNLRVERGTVAGLVGANGAGKTTLIKLILGLTNPQCGSIRLLGQKLDQPENMPDTLKARLGVVLDTCSYTQDSKVADIAQLGRAVYKNWDAPLFASLMDSFAIDKKKSVKELSRGMGMKLSIAFALAHHPELLILDEATAGLDPLARDEILDILRDFMLDEDHTILMSTHITSDLEKIADTVTCIDDGTILFSEQKENVSDEAGIAHLRRAQLEAVLGEPSIAPLLLRVMKREYGADVLVSDRFVFTQACPEIPTDKATIDEYMMLILKGDIPCSQ